MVKLRPDGRKSDQLRTIHIEPNYNLYPEGSVFIAIGNTWVLCNCSVEENIPGWLQKQNRPGGWITAEYSMLPGSTHSRKPRETIPGGRTLEIKRLIGRSLRACINLEQIGSYTYIIDCDVIQADGGTRTASITGGFLSLAIAMKKVFTSHGIQSDVHPSPIAAISVGVVNSSPVLDLTYGEDSIAEVDANIVMTSDLKLVEVQGSAEREPFSRDTWDQLLDLGIIGIKELITHQETMLSKI